MTMKIDNICVAAAAIACLLPPVALLFDLVRPVLVESDLLEKMSVARGISGPSFDRVDLATVAVLTAVIAAICVAALGRYRQALTKSAILTWSVAIPLLAVEASLRLFDRPYVLEPGTETTFHPNPSIMPGVTGPSTFSTNLLGMRGPQWDPGAYKILCIGGSTTICTYLDDQETWPWQLMRLLDEREPLRRFWVGNVGNLGHDTYHHIELLKHLPEAGTVDCALILCGVNDLERSVRLPHDLRERLAPSRTFAVGGPLNPALPYLKQAYLYRRAKALLGQTLLNRGMEVEDLQGKHYTSRRQARQAATKDYPLPPLGEHLAKYRRNLARIAQLCRSRGVRCIFMTQPTIWSENLPPELDELIWSLPIRRTGRAISAADLAKGMAAFNRTTLDFCRAGSVECIDLASACRKDTTVFYDDEHFNENGARFVAERIADYLLRTGLADGTPAGHDRAAASD